MADQVKRERTSDSLLRHWQLSLDCIGKKVSWGVDEEGVVVPKGLGIESERVSENRAREPRVKEGRRTEKLGFS